MRPERSRETGRAARVARGRLIVKADLAWLGGHPTGDVSEAGLAWSVPASAGRPARATSVDRAALHRATRALTELELRFTDVLGDILDEPRVWMVGARAALALLKPLVHAGAPRPVPADAPLSAGVIRGSLVAAIRSAPASLRFVVEAAAWMTLVDPPRLARIVALALANERVASTLRAKLPLATADATMLSLALLADAEGAKRVEPLARLLANRSLYESPTSGVDYARAVSRELRGERGPRPDATVGPSLAAWTGTLLAAEGKARRGTLALLDVLDLAPAAHEWTAWWSRLMRCERLAQAEPEPELDARLQGKATRLAEDAPRPLHGDGLTWLLTRTLRWDEATHREAARTLRELPAYEGGVPVRLAFLEHWDNLADDAGPSKMAPLLHGLGKYLARTKANGARALLPWARLVDRKRRGAWSGAPEDTLVEDVPPARWPVFYEALARAVEDDSLDPSRVSPALLAVVPLVADAGHALDLARAMLPHGGWARVPERLKVTYELCGHDAALFGRAIEAIVETDDRNLMRALTAVRKSGGDELARAALLEDAERLVECGRALAVLALCGGGRELEAVRTTHVDPSWIGEYPAWAAPSLRRLAEAEVAHGERLARRLMGDEVRGAQVMRRELAHLESLVERPQGVSDRMRRRIDNLRARLAAPRPTPASVREHLVAKVERAARRAKLATIAAALDANVRKRLPAFLGLTETPVWLFAPRTLAQLAPMHAFEAPMRSLAVRVLRLRAGPPPWDLRDEPANRQFLQRLTRAGLDMAPWLDGIGTTRVTTPKGAVVDLRLEEDPLEILDMGKHFSTCLTPGDINYFSTFANVADVNKRVLFARDPAGKVLGRCLLALTAAGGIVAFHAYAHDGELGFEAMVAEIAKDLAAQMRAMVVAQGDVPRLVAPDWYDDGAVDLGHRFPFLQDGTEFRQSLATLLPGAFADEARRLFAPLPLGALTLPLLVALPEMDKRPELLVPLLPSLAAAEGLPIATVGRASALLGRTQEAGNAARALVPRIVARLQDAADDDQGWMEGAVASVVEACPGEALRLLRATRARRVRGWSDEHDCRRLEMAARSYDALHRPRLAAQLYRHAASHAWSPKTKQALEARAKELEASLARR